MTELLEPAPMLDDGDDYGGPIKKLHQVDANGVNDAFNDPQKDTDDNTTKQNIDNNPALDVDDNNRYTIHMDDDDEKEKATLVDNRNSNSNSDEEIKENVNNNYDPNTINQNKKPKSQKLIIHETTNSFVTADDDDLRATSTIGENDKKIVKIISSVDDDSGDDNEYSSSKNDSDDYRIGDKNCCLNCYSRLYSYPRLRIFFSFLYFFISLLLLLCEIFSALFIANEIWTFKKAIPELYELYFGIILVFVASPFLILWSAHLIFIEERTRVSVSFWFKYFVKYPFIFLFLITPIGILFLIIYELFYIYLWKMFILLFYRFIFSKPSYKMIINIFKTKGTKSYLRFRKITHLLSSSIPLMLYYLYLWYFDPFPRLRWKYLGGAALISLFNSLFTVISSYRDSKSINISLSQYIILSLRLFGGFIPSLNEIGRGNIRLLNLSSFAFGNYTYASFADVIEYSTCKLRTIILTTSTLSNLSISLCHQLGSVCLSKNINIIILKNYSPYTVWFKYLFSNNFAYRVTLNELKQSIRKCPIFSDKSSSEFDLFENDLDKLYGKDLNNLNLKYYYYSDFIADWNGYNNNQFKYGLYTRLLRILPPHIIDNKNIHTKEYSGGKSSGANSNSNTRDERLLNLVLGSGNINELDKTNCTSALFYAIIQMDYELINRLCNNGAKTSSSEWRKLGEYIIELSKNNNYDQLKNIIDLSKKYNQIEIDLTYHDQNDGKTALMYAAINGNQQIANLLLNSNLGSDILDVDNDGYTAADLAKQNKHLKCEQFLRSQFL